MLYENCGLTKRKKKVLCETYIHWQMKYVHRVNSKNSNALLAFRSKCICNTTVDGGKGTTSVNFRAHKEKNLAGRCWKWWDFAWLLWYWNYSWWHKLKRHAKNPGNIWIMGLQRRETLGGEAFRSLWISTLFLVCFLLLQVWTILKAPSLYCKNLLLFFFISHSRRAKMVPGQLQPQVLLIGAWVRKAATQDYSLQRFWLKSLKTGHKN